MPEILVPVPVAIPVTLVVLSLTQEITVPDTLFGLVKVTVVMASPEQVVCVAEDALIVGVGFTVIVNVLEVPVQPFADGVTVIVAVTGVLPVLIAAKEAMLPVPLAASPIDGLLLVQEYKVPVTAPLKLMAVVLAPLHND